MVKVFDTLLIHMEVQPVITSSITQCLTPHVTTTESYGDGLFLQMCFSWQLPKQTSTCDGHSDNLVITYSPICGFA